MTQVEANNRKIADFMGYIHSKHKDMDDYEMAHLDYEEDWNSLMPVIEKISKIPLLNGSIPCTDPADACYPITFNMPDEEGNVMFRFKGGFLSKAPTLMQAAYNAVVEFIQHYEPPTS